MASTRDVRAASKKAPSHRNTAGAPDTSISVCVRKRPLLPGELERGEIEAVVCNRQRLTSFVAQPAGGAGGAGSGHGSHALAQTGEVTALEHKLKWDGITPIVNHHKFQFDKAFGELHTNADVYVLATPRGARLSPLLTMPWRRYHTMMEDNVTALLAGRLSSVTAFAYVSAVDVSFVRFSPVILSRYGQTGSGKTYTMTGLYTHVTNQLFSSMDTLAAEAAAAGAAPPSIWVSMFEILGSKCADLLQHKVCVCARARGCAWVAPSRCSRLARSPCLSART